MSDKVTLIDKAVYLAKLDRTTGPLLMHTLLDLQKKIKEEDELPKVKESTNIFVRMAEVNQGEGANGVINQLASITESNILSDNQSKGKFR